MNVSSSIAPQRCCFRRFARAASILLTSGCGLGSLVRQGLKDRLAPVTVQLYAGQDLVGEFLLYLGGSHGTGAHGAAVPAMGHAWILPPFVIGTPAGTALGNR